MVHKSLYALAIFFTVTGMAVATAGAVEKGGTTLDCALVVAVSVAMVAAVHFLPAVSKSVLTRAIWLPCLVAVVYTQLYFLMSANFRANEVRAARSPEVVATERQISEYRDMLGAISARPVTEIAAELATATNWRTRKALVQELSEARRAIAAREKIANLTDLVGTLIGKDTTNPVAASVAALLGTTEQTVTLVFNLIPSILLELVAAQLWLEISRRRAQTYAPDETISSTSYGELLADVRGQVGAGRVKETVQDIRKYLRCSQAMAQQIRRDLARQAGDNVATA